MNVHIIIGEDEWLVSQAARKTVGDGVGLEVVDSLNSGNSDLQLADLRNVDASFSTPPFLDPKKTTWWKNVHFLPGGGGRAVSADVKGALEKFAKKVAGASLPDNQKLVISAPHLLKTSVFCKTLEPVAEMSFFAPMKPWEAAKNAVVRVIDEAKALGLEFERGAAEHFVARVGTDLRSLMSELRKMRDYLHGVSTTITRADINEVSSQGIGVEPDAWAITDALGSRDVKQALGAAKLFEREDRFAVFVSGVVERFFRQMVELKTAVADGRFDEATAGMSPFVARKMAVFLRNWSLGELRVARWRFLRLRERSVASSGGAETLVFTEIARVCRRTGAT